VITSVNVLYPAISGERLPAICQKLAAAFDLPPFRKIHSSQHLETAHSGEVLQITVTEFIVPVTSDQAAQIGPPDHWNLAWRAAVGLRFNYQVAIARGTVTRSQQRSIARRLRSVFTEIRLHGDPLTPNPALQATAAPPRS
jgi:hypothetical protein